MKIIYTSALICKLFNERKDEYIKSYNTLKNILDASNISIVECFLSEQKTFLNDLKKEVFYSGKHINVNNKGVNEVLALKEFIKTLNYSDDEIIIKLTGRYLFLSSFFIENINKNSQYDIFVRNGVDNQFFCGCFAMKFKFFKEFINNINTEDMIKNNVSLERELYNYSICRNLKVYEKIDVYSNINNETEFIW